jgi:hypothetical protein
MIDMKDFSERARVEEDFIVTGFNSNEKRIKRFVKPSYSLGYIIGSYLSVGSANLQTYKNSKRGIVFWYFEKRTNKAIIDKFLSALEDSFGLKAFVREQDRSSTFQVVSYSKPLAEFFSLMGKKSGKKRLPEPYLYEDNKEYIRGLLDGLKDFKGYLPDLRRVMKKRYVNIYVIELYKRLKSIDTGY